MIIVSHNPDYIRDHCHRAVVLSEGQMHAFDTLDESYEFYMSQQYV